jgi:hypothetical protein
MTSSSPDNGSINRKAHTMKLYRQGDVLVQQITTIPTGLQQVPRDNGRVILAYGEVTGHAHAVVGDVEFLAADLAELEERFLRVEAEAQIVHEEHDTIVLPPGNYRVVRQREYAPAAPVYVAD